MRKLLVRDSYFTIHHSKVYSMTSTTNRQSSKTAPKIFHLQPLNPAPARGPAWHQLSHRLLRGLSGFGVTLGSGISDWASGDVFDLGFRV